MAKTKKDLVKVVNQEISNFGVLYVKLHNYHWYVNGPHFFGLHEKLEELYNEISIHLDELAERLLAIEEKPAATIKEFMEYATLKEATGEESTEEMIGTIINDFKMVAEELVDGISIAEEAGDQATGDMLVSIQQSVQKHAWMLRAYLGKQ